MKTLALVLGASLTLLVSALHAASVTVNTTVDEVNGNTSSIANLIATPGGAGISLREAIIAANNTAGADTILFNAATNGTPFTLTRSGDDDTASLGDLDALDSLTITGNGATNTIIQGGTNATNGIDKVLALNPTCAVGLQFTVTGITVRFGRNTTLHDARFQDTGGGIDWCGAGTGASAPSLTISNCVITQNSTLYNNAGDSGHYGGGLNIDAVAPSNGVVTITNTVFSNNSCTAHGGGLNLFGDNEQVTITGSTFSGNTTLGTNGVGAQGGGINIRITNQNDGDGAPTPFVNISNSTIVNNTGVGFGGGIDLQGSGNQDVNISTTAITGNSLIVTAGGVTNTSGGGLDHSNNAARTTTLTNVLIANNQSNGSATSLGGGISHGAGNLIVRNSTITGNTTASDGGGVYVTTDPTLTLINTTISNNRADSDNNASGTGGGIRKLAGGGTVTLQNTISDGNFRGTGSTVDEVNGAITANFSLIGNTTGATIGGANNQLNLSGRLAALANNGGQTVGPAGFTAVLQTHALLAGSSALDNGSNALVPGALTTDQRGTGFVRTLDAADANTTDTVDIGALEQHPSVEDVANQTINEDGSVGFSFNVGDADLVFDAITATSSNTTLVPNVPANINLSGSGSSRTLTINPVANQFGTSTITLTATDTVAGTVQTMADTFVLTVNPIADTPSVTNATTAEDTLSASGLVISRNIVDGAEVTHFKITGITGGTLFKNNGTSVINNNDFITFTEGNSGLKFTPGANLNTPAGNTFGFTAQAALDAVGTGISPSTSASITVTEVNDPPTAGNDTLTDVAEDSGQRTILAATLTGNDSRGPANEGGQTLTITAVGSAVGGTVSLSGGNVLFDPTLNFNGPASFSYTITDNGTTNGAADPKMASATASFMITPVNDAPVITGQNAVSTLEDTARTIVFADLLVTDVDNPYPAGFTLTVMAGTNYTFAGNAVTPAANFNGPLTVPVKVNDGLADSNTFNLSVSVTAVNDKPTFTAASPPAVNEDAVAQTVTGWVTNFNPGPNEASQTVLAYTVSNVGNPGLFSAGPAVATNGNLTYTPAANANGTSTFQVTVQDSGGTTPGVDTSDPQTFTITVNAVNDKPTFTAASPPAVNEDAVAQTVPGWVTNFNPGPNEAGQTVLAYTVSNVSNPGLFSAGPAVANNGTLTYTPAANANSTSTFDVRVQDSGGAPGIDLSDAQTFTITVNAVNDNPAPGTDTLVRYPSQSVKVRISALLSNDTDPELNPLSLTAVSSALPAGAVVTQDGSWVYYTPPTGSTSAGSFAYTISDGQGGTANGLVNVNIIVDNATGQNITKMETLGDGSKRLTFGGIPGRTYRVQSTDSLAPAAWVDRATVPADAQGKFQFTDPIPLPPTRFYRSVSP